MPHTQTKFKIIFIDIDSTLINRERELSNGTIKEIKRVSSLGVKVILASSRIPKSMRYFLEELGINEPIISHNGGLIQSELKTGGDVENLFSKQLNYGTAEAVYSAGQEIGIHTGFYLNDNWYEESVDRWVEREINNTRAMPQICNIKSVLDDWKVGGSGPHKIMCMGDGEKMDRFSEIVKKSSGDSVNAYRSKKTYLEVTSAETSKKTAAEFLQKRYGFKREEVIAIGDNYNDVEMIRWAGLGVVMGNARDAVKQHADYVAPPNYDDGVASVVKKYFP